MLFLVFGVQYIIFIFFSLTYAKPTKNHTKSTAWKTTITRENSKGKRQRFAMGLYCWNKHKGRNLNFETTGSSDESIARPYERPALFIIWQKTIYKRPSNFWTSKKKTTSKKLFIRNLWKLCTELILLIVSRSGFGKPRKTRKWRFLDSVLLYFVYYYEC